MSRFNLVSLCTLAGLVLATAMAPSTSYAVGDELSPVPSKVREEPAVRYSLGRAGDCYAIHAEYELWSDYVADYQSYLNFELGLAARQLGEARSAFAASRYLLRLRFWRTRSHLEPPAKFLREEPDEPGTDPGNPLTASLLFLEYDGARQLKSVDYLTYATKTMTALADDLEFSMFRGTPGEYRHAMNTLMTEAESAYIDVVTHNTLSSLSAEDFRSEPVDQLRERCTGLGSAPFEAGNSHE